jgi:glycerate kinase
VAVTTMPIADGGEGTLAAATAAGFDPVAVTARGPTGVPGPAWYARLGTTALIEMASVCGLARLPGGRPAPLTASSRGLGEVIAAALAAGHERLIVGLGGSASTDGGAGMLAALGARILDASGRPIPDGGSALGAAVSLDLTALHTGLSATQIVLATDVDSPLTGHHGAASVFAPQKGADQRAVAQLDRALGRWADLVAGSVGRDERSSPGAGAAGGVGFGAIAALGAQRRSGVDVVLELVGFDAAVTEVDLVVVGEGSLDEQSLRGKAPVGAARRAARAGAEVVAVCGRTTLDVADLRPSGISAAYACMDYADGDPARSVTDARELLERIGAVIATRHLQLDPPGSSRG